MKLVIVESPTKSHTFERYLGKEYTILASVGHIRDLATKGKGGLGVDVDHDFTPQYEINKDKASVVSSLKKAAAKASEVIIATDPDREGEAIAWHLATVLKLPLEQTKRLEFHEITRESIGEAIKNPRTINMGLVSSQETRRIVDRIIGFKLSKLLFKKIKSRSAGRVQSAALKILIDHEEKINAFVPEEYWTLAINLNCQEKPINLSLDKVDGKTIKIKNEAELRAILSRLGDEVVVTNIKVHQRSKAPKAPLTTSTLQQEAYNLFKFSTRKTSSIAQKLYEGLPVENGEHVGLITYMRTDSPRLSLPYIGRARNYLLETLGSEYIGQSISKGKQKETEIVQDAHEAIRPTSNHRTPQSIKDKISKDEYNLYRLIYARALASLMPAKIEEVTTVSFASNGLTFTLEGVRTIFDGYSKIIGNLEVNNEQEIPLFKVGDVCPIVDKKYEQNFTKAPPRYSEARLVKAMEELGIGRPSTYASTIDTLKLSKYISISGGIITPTERGSLTIATLEQHFSELISTTYTARMEKELDEIASGKASRLDILNEFYAPFIEKIEVANNELEKQEIQTGELCPVCGHPLVRREGRYGSFVGCSDYPTCKYIQPQVKVEPKQTGEMCPVCGKPLVERKSKRGTTFIACSGYPSCRYIHGANTADDKPKPVYTEKDYVKPCPKCKTGHLVKKVARSGTEYLGCTNAPKCNGIEWLTKKK